MFFVLGLLRTPGGVLLQEGLGNPKIYFALIINRVWKFMTNCNREGKNGVIKGLDEKNSSIFGYAE
jgi:hypothetical protein